MVIFQDEYLSKELTSTFKAILHRVSAKAFIPRKRRSDSHARAHHYVLDIVIGEKDAGQRKERRRGLAKCFDWTRSQVPSPELRILEIQLYYLGL